ncbi:hypothetical protein [Saccharibacillus sacchari]|uniref:Uncharacterized protein n=1 Tax=Saccharibacillus sacchari TaxID=456493 RepID=A0ACC6PIK3_9BACL
MKIEHRPVPKPGKTRRSAPSQRQLGEIGDSADVELKARSLGICELCGEAWATERAHLTGRRHIKHKTSALDLVHLCKECHVWLDETPTGIRARNLMAVLINYASERFREFPGTSENAQETKGTFVDG